jgi:hypothetical protein
MSTISGHVYRHEGARRPVWRAKYRLPDGRQVHRTIGPACAEFLRYVEVDLDRKPSTLRDYRSTIQAHLVPAFGSLRLEDVTADRIEAWKATLTVSNRTKAKTLIVMNGVFVRARRAFKLPYNPMGDVEMPRQRRSTAIEVFAPEEIFALVAGPGRAQVSPRSSQRAVGDRHHRAPDTRGQGVLLRGAGHLQQKGRGLVDRLHPDHHSRAQRAGDGHASAPRPRRAGDT